MIDTSLDFYMKPTKDGYWEARASASAKSVPLGEIKPYAFGRTRSEAAQNLINELETTVATYQQMIEIIKAGLTE